MVIVRVNIYKISSPNTDDIYIGSTTFSLERTLEIHSLRTNQKKSKHIINAGNPKIELLEYVECDEKQLSKYERKYYKQYKKTCVNIPHDIKHKLMKALSRKKEKFNELIKINDMTICKCGSVVNYNGFEYHLNSFKHMSSVNEQQ